MVPEISGITKAMAVAKEEVIINLLLITYSIASITFTTISIKSPINSRSLQNNIEINPVLGHFCKEIKNISGHFQFLRKICPKSLTNYTSINAILNNGTDQIARARAEELLRIMTQ